MKKYFLGSMASVLIILFQVAPASAEIRFIKTSNGTTLCDTKDRCAALAGSSLPIIQGKSATFTIVGPYVDRHTNLSVSGTGVIPRETNKRAVRVFGEDMGEIDITFNVRNDAATGQRTVGIHYALGIFGTDNFKIEIVAAPPLGKVTGGDSNLNLDNYFQEPIITLTGENIGNAKADVYHAEGGSLIPSEVLGNSNNTRALIKLKFPELRADAKVNIVLKNKTTGDKYVGLTVVSPTASHTTVTLTGPNAVKSITFPDGGSVSQGSVFTMQINLVKQAKDGGEVVSWQLVPSTVFSEAQGSGTSFSPTGLNRQTIRKGDTLARLQVKLDKIPDGCATQCFAEIQTRMVNVNTDQAPYFRSARFTIVAPRRQ